jgi:hypothetical protein
VTFFVQSDVFVRHPPEAGGSPLVRGGGGVVCSGPRLGRRLRETRPRLGITTDERLDHVERRPEMAEQLSTIEETLADPDEIRESNRDDAVHLYYRHYSETPVTETFLLVVAKIGVDDPFVITAFFTDRIESGRRIDPDTGDIEQAE